MGCAAAADFIGGGGYTEGAALHEALVMIITVLSPMLLKNLSVKIHDRK